MDLLCALLVVVVLNFVPGFYRNIRNQVTAGLHYNEANRVIQSLRDRHDTR